MAGPFDYKAALSRVEGDEVLLADLGKLFSEESPKMLAAVNAAVAHQDADALQRAAHSIKGSIATFAAAAAFEAALSLERMGRAKDLSAAEKGARVLAAEVERLRGALGDLIAQQERSLEAEELSS